MIDYATRAMLGAEVKKVDASTLDLDHVGVKAAQFSFSRLKGADPVPGVEMASTGEVGCIANDMHDAFLLALLSVGFRIPVKKRILLSTGPVEYKAEFLESARTLLSMGYELCASKGTAKFLRTNKVKVTELNWPSEKKAPNIADWIKAREFDLVINIPKNNQKAELRNDYTIRRMAVDFEIPLITDIKVAVRFVDAIQRVREKPLVIKSWEEFKA
jgi:carbamoyl-phosphate synthase large subunit